MTDRPITVSDHAVLRYLERVLQEDIEGLRAEIEEIVRRAEDLPEELPDATAVLKDGFRFCIRGGVVVTVLPVAWPNKHNLRVLRGKP